MLRRCVHQVVKRRNTCITYLGARTKTNECTGKLTKRAIYQDFSRLTELTLAEAFKHTFADLRTDNMLNLLNVISNATQQPKIVSIKAIECPSESTTLRRSILYVLHCIEDSGAEMIIKLQYTSRRLGLADKLIGLAAPEYSSQWCTGGSEINGYEMIPVRVIVIQGCRMDSRNETSDSLVQHYHLQSALGIPCAALAARLATLSQFTVVKLSQAPSTIGECTTDIERLAVLLRDSCRLGEIPEEMQVSPFAEIIAGARTATFSPAEMALYERDWTNARDEEAVYITHQKKLKELREEHEQRMKQIAEDTEKIKEQIKVLKAQREALLKGDAE